MQQSCESVKHSEDRRPASCKFLELHVLYVPGDQWNVKLNKVPAEAIESFISAGFIRVYPDITLKTLRTELRAFLGAERSIDKFSFLKCVGRSLALVKSKQEGDLKVKTFAPPYAPQPELYLLPAVESGSSVCSQSLTPDTSSSSPDQQTYYQPPKTCNQPAGTKEPWAEQQCCTKKHHNQRAPQPVSQNNAVQRCEADSDEVKENEETCRKKKQHQRQNRGARDSGAVQPLEDRDSGFSLSDGLGKSKDAHALKSIRNKQSSDVKESPAVLSRPGFSSPPQGLPIVTPKKPIHRVFHTNREELIEEIKMVREERKQLEWTRQELLRKGKDLLAQNRHRRNQARDSWKKKYFETKKATAPLEENLRNLRQELETFYNKLLHQLQARDNRGKPRRQGRSSIKNELIIQIMTESHEIDNLKRKVEDAKMKLITEIKLRKQAATELRALKAELAQKKSQSSHPSPMSSLGFGSTTRETPQAQRTSI
ncbi:hypothetical protein JOQ06_005398 [Pogonophryne albipinna]|uniref:Spermatogenesis-associated protein 1 C-terminal domain-containing protein n=1 Tax=Pogonophryne albipinna TaxID=1090488 RepID=A0AAD6BDT6_9TELE|nr:hypothetical protein JOQ06_005398 [Pogonophryne albipinna]